MADAPTLDDLLGDVVVLRDAHGRRARFVIDHVRGAQAVCTYVFRGRHEPPTRCAPGEPVELGTAGERGWIVAAGRVESARTAASVTVDVDEITVVQRRSAYREEVVLPFVLRADSPPPRRGRTDNLSIGGFAARIEGLPIPDGREVWVTFDMPEGDALTLACRKVSGDLQQRFGFIDLDRATEDRLARLVRGIELAKRRSRRPLD